MIENKGLQIISRDDCYLFGKGTHYNIYQKLGAHACTINGTSGMYFAVWAPHAISVHLVGDFNHWDATATPMQTLYTSGIWEVFVPNLGLNELYKFAIQAKNGEIIFKADPYARAAEYRPGTASKTTIEPKSLVWSDDKWMTQRAKVEIRHQPLSIYECHLGSWKKNDNVEFDGCLNYRELAHQLAEYLNYMGYTHVELMGIAEYPFDGSWGYQVTGYYAPTSRYGSMEDFQYMINYLHNKKIGVILDWVPAHFPKDAFGLANFDGEPLYEYADTRKGEHPDWGTKVFDYTKTEVKNFLIANALYWLNDFHIDGLRVDAVASMLYLDYGRQDGQWVPNQYGGNKNLEAIEFFKHLNSLIAGRKDGTMIIAEESTAWPKVTHTPEDDGLGFTFKWNMGWMHDFLEYMKLDPYFRKYNHNKMTFSMSYATSENFILVLSHDEVVHLKCSMINKMPGIYEDKFANLKCGYAFMMGHPGKKLLFMGQDFAQFHEWDEKVSLDWYLIDEPLHRDVNNFYRGLLHIYQKYSCMYELDDSWDGFSWINADDADRSIFSFVRYNKKKKKNLLFVINFTPMNREDYMVGVPKKGTYRLILDQLHGSYSLVNKKPIPFKAVKGECDHQPYHVKYPLAPYGVAIFEFS
jgi:1,4-alpha-glucan branching enzyme